MTGKTGQTAGAGRLEWLDTAKGIGIVLVVAGHVLVAQDSAWKQVAGQFIYMFHMPFFFMVSGYTLKVESLGPFAYRRTLSLLVPYSVALLLMGLPATVVSCGFGSVPAFGIGTCPGFPARLIAGGSSIGGIFSVFWFPTCLFVSLLAAQVVLRSAGARLSVLGLFAVGLYGLGYVLPLALPATTMVWSLGVAPMAVVFILGGFFIRRLDRTPQRVIVPALIIPLAILLSLLVPQLIDMKRGLYGTPVIGLVTGLGLSLSLWFCARLAIRLPHVAEVLSFLGSKTMPIMYFHQLIHYTLRAFGVENSGLLVLSAVVLPLALDRPFEAVASRIQNWLPRQSCGKTLA
jgi:fucose 4-O-acetylase-like acetyltransferase